MSAIKSDAAWRLIIFRGTLLAWFSKWSSLIVTMSR